MRKTKLLAPTWSLIRSRWALSWKINLLNDKPYLGLFALIIIIFFQNVLHWHIVDTQSFPLEIPSYPKLWDGAYSVSERYTFADAAEIVRQVFSGVCNFHIILLNYITFNVSIKFLQLCPKSRNSCTAWNWCSWTCTLMVMIMFLCYIWWDVMERNVMKS